MEMNEWVIAIFSVGEFFNNFFIDYINRIRYEHVFEYSILSSPLINSGPFHFYFMERENMLQACEKMKTNVRKKEKSNEGIEE